MKHPAGMAYFYRKTLLKVENDDNCYGSPKVSISSGLANYNLLFYLQNFKAFSIDEHTIEGHENPESTIPPLISSFSKVSQNILAIADEDGGVIICDTSKSGPLALKQEWMAHTNAIFDIDWMIEENKLLTASGDKTIILWDVEREEKISVFCAHTSSVKRAQFRPNCNSVFASGGRDGHIHVWDTRVKQKAGRHHPVNTLRNPHAIQANVQAGKKRRQDQNVTSQQSVTSVIFQDDHSLISTGSVDGTVKVWDMRKIYSNVKSVPIPKESFPYAGKGGRSHGFSDLVFDSSRSRLFCSCMDHTVYQYDCAAFTQQPVARFQGHSTDSFYIKLSLSPCDRFLISGSSDANAYIWSIDDPIQDPVILKGHSGEVSSVSWSPKYLSNIVTTSDDGTMRVWRLHMDREDQQHQLGVYVGKAERTEKTKDLSTCKWTTRLFPRPPVQKPIVVSPKKPETPRKACPFQSPHKGGLHHSPGKSGAHLLSPTYGTTLPHSPAKISSMVKRAISEMNSGTATVSEKSKVKKHLVNSSITRWLHKPTNVSNTRSPRKLIITPKKLNNDVQGKFESMSTSQNTTCVQRTEKHSIKRKLTDIFGGDSESPNKDSDTENIRSPCRKRLCTSPETAASTILKTVSNINTETKLCDTNKSSIEDMKTPIKHLSTPIRNSKSLNSPQYRSPTVDLPNYVFNPEPRTPRAQMPNTTPKRTSDWLTRMRSERDSCKKEGDQEVPIRKTTVTPKSSRKLKKVATGIEKFFSPKDGKK